MYIYIYISALYLIKKISIQAMLSMVNMVNSSYPIFKLLGSAMVQRNLDWKPLFPGSSWDMGKTCESCSIILVTIWLFNIAMENHIFLIAKPSINVPFCMAMLNNQRVNILSNDVASSFSAIFNPLK